ncbi:unnamed protein product, partial [Prorocentrum cordatum]
QVGDRVRVLFGQEKGKLGIVGRVISEKNQATRIKRRYMMDGTCVRISKVSGSAMPAPVPVGVNEREQLYALHEAKWLREDKSRRGPPKEDFFGNKSPPALPFRDCSFEGADPEKTAS